MVDAIEGFLGSGSHALVQIVMILWGIYDPPPDVQIETEAACMGVAELRPSLG